MIKTVFGDDFLSQSKIVEWYKRFKDGHTSTEDTVAQASKKLFRDRDWTIFELAIKIGIVVRFLTNKLQVIASFWYKNKKKKHLMICEYLINIDIVVMITKFSISNTQTFAQSPNIFKM